MALPATKRVLLASLGYLQESLAWKGKLSVGSMLQYKD